MGQPSVDEVSVLLHDQMVAVQRSATPLPHPFVAVPSKRVKSTLSAVRSCPVDDQRDLRLRVITHWRARAKSTFRLGDLKEAHLRYSLFFVGSLAYFIARVL